MINIDEFLNTKLDIKIKVKQGTMIYPFFRRRHIKISTPKGKWILITKDLVWNKDKVHWLLYDSCISSLLSNKLFLDWILDSFRWEVVTKELIKKWVDEGIGIDYDFEIL